MTQSRKKVIVRRFSGELIAGYMLPANFIHQEEAGYVLDLLDLQGHVLLLPLNDIKFASYVRDFNISDASDPERLRRKTFLARPRSEGLWIRFVLQDGDTLEGLAPIDLTLADSLVRDFGIQVTPPDIRSNTQKMYIPRSAILEMQAISVITTPSRKRSALVAETRILQKDLFPPDLLTPDTF